MEIEKIVEAQKEFFLSGGTRGVKFRIEMLKRLKHTIKKYEKDLADALWHDLKRNAFDAYAAEIGIVYDEIEFMIKNIAKWQSVKKVKTPPFLFPNKSYIMKEPYGTVLIIAPWNYPFQLLFSPLVGAIAGGNTVVLKPSELAAKTAEVSTKIIKEAFDENYMAVVNGDAAVSKELLKQKFDYIFFTGSVPVGKVVMDAAAKQLIPVTLELGGKSPAIVAKDADLDDAAAKIVWGKCFNAGQTCVAPDYILVEKEIKDELILKIKEKIMAFYGENSEESNEFGKIISERHFDRLVSLIDKNKVVFGGKSNGKTLYIEPTIMDDVELEDEIMKDEIFGPIIPIMAVENIEKAIEVVRGLPKPLALYVFTNDEKTAKKVLKNTTSGGSGVNNVVTHVASKYLPFGGVGPSGIGNYHGKASFDAFTHSKSVMAGNPKLDLKMAFPGSKPSLKLIKMLLK